MDTNTLINALLEDLSDRAGFPDVAELDHAVIEEIVTAWRGLIAEYVKG